MDKEVILDIWEGQIKWRYIVTWIAIEGRNDCAEHVRCRGTFRKDIEKRPASCHVRVHNAVEFVEEHQEGLSTM